MNTPNKDRCIFLLENEVEQYEAQLYIVSVRVRAAKVVENKELESRLQEEIEKTIKVIDFFNKEIEKVRNA